MTRHLLAGALVYLTMGCAVSGTVPGRVLVSPPPVVVDAGPPQWHWGVWPHPVVVHQYVVHDQPVFVEHHHYYPFYDRIHHIRHEDHGKHKGWYKHHDDD
jgi:hypothetical protein